MREKVKNILRETFCFLKKFHNQTTEIKCSVIIFAAELSAKNNNMITIV